MPITFAHLAPIDNTAPPVPSPRAVRAAHEFEAQMMKELLGPLSTRDSLTGESEEDDAGSTGALGDFATESLGQALSMHGGLGIAARIIQDLFHTGKVAQSGPASPSTGPSMSLK